MSSVVSSYYNCVILIDLKIAIVLSSLIHVKCDVTWYHSYWNHVKSFTKQLFLKSIVSIVLFMLTYRTELIMTGFDFRIYFKQI